MSGPTTWQLTAIARLLQEVAAAHGVGAVTVGRALSATKTMRRLGMTEAGVVETEVQADACIQILESWKYKRRIK